MADIEKVPQATDATTAFDSDSYNNKEGHGINSATPSGRKYKSLKVGPLSVPYYASPAAQLLLVSLVCFLCPGMFNALSGIGGGGQVDTKTADVAGLTLYSVFAVVGFFAGTICNRLGIKFSLSIGGLGYCVYIASFLSYSHTQNKGFNIFAGALLGLCAGLLWTAQGAIMMSYPEERNKGRYISWFWIIFNLGAVIGSLIPLGQNVNVTSKSTVTDGTYVGFIVLTFLGALLAWTLVDAKDVVRNDGSRIIIMKHPTWKSELWGLVETFKQDPWVAFLFPMFWSSNWFYTYQFNDVNAPYFSTRTSALNNLLYWLMQIAGALVFGYGLDNQKLSRPLKAKIAWTLLFIMTMGIWGGGFAFQDYTRAETEAEDYPHMDWTQSGYGGPLVLYMAYGFYDAAWQTCVYWFMGALTNNGRKLANFAGFYKGIQSAGAAVVFALDYHRLPFLNMFASCWALLGASLLIALPLIWLKIPDSVSVETDLKFSDETFKDVLPTSQLEEVERRQSSAAASLSHA